MHAICIKQNKKIYFPLATYLYLSIFNGMEKPKTMTLAMWAKDERCNVVYTTLFKWVNSGKLRATRPKGGGKWMVTEKDFLECINGESNIR